MASTRAREAMCTNFLDQKLDPAEPRGGSRVACPSLHMSDPSTRVPENSRVGVPGARRRKRPKRFPIWVGNIPGTATGADLWSAFAPFGRVIRARVVPPRNPESSAPLFGFVWFEREEGARAALNAGAPRVFRRRLRVGVARNVRGAPNLFCDLDGVLADFAKSAKEITGTSAGAVHEAKDPETLGRFWDALQSVPEPGFFAKLDWMPGGPELWAAIRGLNPTVLSGVPRGDWAAPQKREWCMARLGVDVPVITCTSMAKPRHARPGDVLIDDSKTAGRGWEGRGGVYVLHTSLNDTLDQLRSCGVLPPTSVVAGSKRKQREKVRIYDLKTGGVVRGVAKKAAAGRPALLGAWAGVGGGRAVAQRLRAAGGVRVADFARDGSISDR